MNISTVFLVLLSLVGSVRILESLPSPLVLLAMLTAFLLADTHSDIRMKLSFLVAVTTMGVIHGGITSLVSLCVVFATGAVVTRPVKDRSHLDTALYVSAAILAVLSLWAYITRRGEIHWLILLTVAIGWISSSRIARINLSTALVRVSFLLPIAVVSFLLIFPGVTSNIDRGGDGFVSTTQGSIDRIHDLQEKIATDPWNPSIWYELGTEFSRQGNTHDAYQAFENGWKSKPGRSNPCLIGLLDTAQEIGAWRRIAEFMLEGYVPSSWISDRGRVPVASELWRMGRGHLALTLLETSRRRDTFVQEMVGWIAMDTGDMNRALKTLRPLGQAMTSGETVFRTAELMRIAGYDNVADSLARQGSTLFPRHLQLGVLHGVSPRDSTLDSVAPHEDGLKLGNAVKLLGWKSYPDTVIPGETFIVITEWTAVKPLLDMILILHVDKGMPTSWRYNADHIPCSGSCPTSRWHVGEVVRDTAFVHMPIDAPGGEMIIYTGLWIPGDPDSRLLPEDTAGYLLPRGELRIPLGTIYSTSRR